MRGVLKYQRPRTNPISKRKYSREFRGDSSCTRAVKPGAAGRLYSDGLFGHKSPEDVIPWA